MPKAPLFVTLLTAALASHALVASPALAMPPAPAQPASAAAPAAPAIQIASAVQAAPPDRREAATVLGFDATGALVELRKGTNDLVCVADDPSDPAIAIVCYHADLAPFFARGRELLAQGVKGRPRDETRWKEIEAGTLKMPKETRASYVLTGKSLDAATGAVGEPFLRWVLYTPYATAESTGLPTTPAPGAPWLMFAGTPGAHIMITPPRP
jgi:hypothetical protein